MPHIHYARLGTSTSIGRRAARSANKKVNTPHLPTFGQQKFLSSLATVQSDDFIISGELPAPETYSHLLGHVIGCPFKVTVPYAPTGDQPEAIAQLLDQLQKGEKCSILQGITGTVKHLSCQM